MPRYDYECRACGAVEEQIHGFNDKPSRCSHCKSRNVVKLVVPVAIKPPPDSGWETENGGRGRYISQLQRKPGPEFSDSTAFARSQSEAIDKAKRRGFTVERAR